MIWGLKGTSGLQTDMTFENLKGTLEILDFITRKKDKEFHCALSKFVESIDILSFSL